MKELKIDTIKFFDYRAFYNGMDDDYFIKLSGKNLLIYGENGSGKTSFYRGLKDFFHCNDFTTHNQTPRESEGFVEVSFTDGTSDRLEESGDKPTKTEVHNTARLNSFLSYKELLKTHLFEEDEEINLFELLVDEMLKFHNLGSLGELGNAWKKIKTKSIDKEKKKLKESFDRDEINEEEFAELLEEIPESIREELKGFNSELDVLVENINVQLKILLPFFDQNLLVKLLLDPIQVENYDMATISLEVHLFGQLIPSHHDFLNEARLSALAISIYLSALKLNPTSDAVKLVFLDDVFLGLDTGNRIPLMNILNSEFNDWQIFITTYDRHWFEIARRHLIGKWEKLEMYAGIG